MLRLLSEYWKTDLSIYIIFTPVKYEQIDIFAHIIFLYKKMMILIKSSLYNKE